MPGEPLERARDTHWMIRTLQRNRTEWVYIYTYIERDYFEGLIYLFMRDTESEAETQAERESGSMQGARHGTRSQVSRITP